MRQTKMKSSNMMAKLKLTSVEKLQLEIETLVRIPYVQVSIAVVNRSKYKYLATNHYGETVSVSKSINEMRYNLNWFFAASTGWYSDVESENNFEN